MQREQVHPCSKQHSLSAIVLRIKGRLACVLYVDVLVVFAAIVTAYAVVIELSTTVIMDSIIGHSTVAGLQYCRLMFN